MLHDNACLCTAACAVESLQQLKHPLYSPHLAPPDCHMFDPLRGTLRGCHFASDQEVIGAMHVWIVTLPKTFFSEGIQKLVDH
jgi:hypothetical protein